MAGGQETDKTEWSSEDKNLQLKWLQIGRNNDTITTTILKQLVNNDMARGFIKKNIVTDKSAFLTYKAVSWCLK